VRPGRPGAERGFGVTLAAGATAGLTEAVLALAVADLWLAGGACQLPGRWRTCSAVIVPLAWAPRVVPSRVAYLRGPFEPRRGRGGGARFKARPRGPGTRLPRARRMLAAPAARRTCQGKCPQYRNAAG